MKKQTHFDWYQFSRYLALGLMASFVIAIAYFANAKPIDNDTLSQTVVTETSDYNRVFEDNLDDQPLFLFTYLLNQYVPNLWQQVLNSNPSQPAVSSVGYRARPRSPPFQA